MPNTICRISYRHALGATCESEFRQRELVLWTSDQMLNSVSRTFILAILGDKM